MMRNLVLFMLLGIALTGGYYHGRSVGIRPGRRNVLNFACGTFGDDGSLGPYSGYPYRYAFQGLPSWLTASGNSLYGTPPSGQYGPWFITVNFDGSPFSGPSGSSEIAILVNGYPGAGSPSSGSGYSPSSGSGSPFGSAGSPGPLGGAGAGYPGSTSPGGISPGGGFPTSGYPGPGSSGSGSPGGAGVYPGGFGIGYPTSSLPSGSSSGPGYVTLTGPGAGVYPTGTPAGTVLYNSGTSSSQTTSTPGGGTSTYNFSNTTRVVQGGPGSSYGVYTQRIRTVTYNEDSVGYNLLVPIVNTVTKIIYDKAPAELVVTPYVSCYDQDLAAIKINGDVNEQSIRVSDLRRRISDLEALLARLRPELAQLEPILSDTQTQAMTINKALDECRQRAAAVPPPRIVPGKVTARTETTTETSYVTKRAG